MCVLVRSMHGDTTISINRESWCTLSCNDYSQVASLASATAGVASLAPLTSHHTATQCLSIIEMIN